jgi:hypothetical protein
MEILWIGSKMDNNKMREKLVVGVQLRAGRIDYKAVR